jgi:hypothetical protein
MASYQVGSACYGSPTQAAQVAASSVGGSVINEGGRSFFVSVGPVTDTSISYVLTSVDKSISYTSVQPYTAQPCAMLGAVDGITLGWMVVAPWIAAYCLMFLTRAFRGETGGNYGNA